jgi:hypothetical protein
MGSNTRILVTVFASLSIAAAASAAESVKQIGTIAVPGTPLDNFDISFVDQATHRYYLADRSNAAIDIFDSQKGSYIGRVAGFAGATEKSTAAGPNGVVIVGGKGEAWVSDGDSTVKVIDLKANKIVDTIHTGGKKRADEMAWGGNVVVVVNNADEPPFATLISTEPGHKIIGKVEFKDATDGTEQPQFHPGNGHFYISIPQLRGDKKIGGVAEIDPKTAKLIKITEVADCRPQGLVHGPGSTLLIGCNDGAKGNPPPMAVAFNVDTGALKKVPGVGAGDMVAYDGKAGRYYVAANHMPGGGVLGVLDAKANTWLENVKVPGNPKSVAVDESNGHIFMPIPAADGGCACIGIYGTGK